MPSTNTQLAHYQAQGQRVADASAQVVFLGDDPTALLRLLELAAMFSEKQRFNLHIPIGFDLVDIGTTIFVHLGLSYSVLFNFAGLATAAAHVGIEPRCGSDKPDDPQEFRRGSRSTHVGVVESVEP